MPHEFAELLQQCINERFGQDDGALSAFARATKAGPERNIVSQISGVLNGRNNPPKPQIEKWADALGLKGRARESFVREAWLTHAQPDTQALVAELRASLAEKEKQLVLSREQLALSREKFRQIVAELRASGQKIPKGVIDG